MNLITKQKQTHRHRKETYGYQRGKRGEEEIGGIGLTDALTYIKQVNNKDLLYYSTENYIQYLVIT